MRLGVQSPTSGALGVDAAIRSKAHRSSTGTSLAGGVGRRLHSRG